MVLNVNKNIYYLENVNQYLFKMQSEIIYIDGSGRMRELLLT